MLGTTRGKRLDQYTDDYVVFDLETTGISAANDEVIEISALKVRAGKVVDEFSTLVNPQRPIPYSASRVNGITDDMVQSAPLFAEALAKFIEFIGADVLVGHNIHTFDMKFIWRDAEYFYKKVPTNDYIDTLRVAKRCLPQMSYHRLTDLAEFYHISAEGAHRALNDCYMNQAVFERLKAEKPPVKAEQSVEKECPLCGSEMKKRKGRFGEFWGCSGYPQCRYTENA